MYTLNKINLKIEYNISSFVPHFHHRMTLSVKMLLKHPFRQFSNGLKKALTILIFAPRSAFVPLLKQIESRKLEEKLFHSS